MNLLYISGSPRKKSNTDYLLNMLLNETDGRFIKLTEYHIEACMACRDCRGLGNCTIDDDMRNTLIPELLACDAMVLGSPIYFNDVSAQMKAFMDRTHCLIGLLTNKIGGAVVVGRRYGAESAIATINAFFLKHQMIPANRGIFGIAFAAGEIVQDNNALAAVQPLASRLLELGDMLGYVADGE